MTLTHDCVGFFEMRFPWLALGLLVLVAYGVTVGIKQL